MGLEAWPVDPVHLKRGVGTVSTDGRDRPWAPEGRNQHNGRHARPHALHRPRLRPQNILAQAMTPSWVQTDMAEAYLHEHAAEIARDISLGDVVPSRRWRTR